MLGPFFRLAMLSISRQAAFRRAVITHLLALGAVAALTYARGAAGQAWLAQFLLVAGIVEGATLVGWRLTQMPKSRALEFILVSPVQPRRVFLAEALVGLSRLALITLSGLPILAVLAFLGRLELVDLLPLMMMPFTWGAITGLGLTVWAYEPLSVRRRGERVLLALIVLYLLIGVLAGEQLLSWLNWAFPERRLQAGDAAPVGQDGDGTWYAEIWPFVGWLIWKVFQGIHTYSPFQVMQYWFQRPAWIARETMFPLEGWALAAVGLLLWRAASRLKGHFHERHYSPIRDPVGNNRGTIGGRPLSWWAVRRVTEYSGRVNIWLAGGFVLIYAAYILTGSSWPHWLGRMIFVVTDQAGGIPMLTTGLVILSAVPAAFQYGLWDSNAQDRCRRLELLLLTELDASDYWEAAAAAAWRRGRGYFLAALLLWGSGLAAGRLNLFEVAAGIAAGVVLWGLHFTLGFRAFSRGMQANGLGSLLTLGLPLVTVGMAKAGWTELAALLPPGSVYYASAGGPSLWAVGAILAGAATLCIARRALSRCDGELRSWYDRNHGSKIAE
jgi:hypothetical protein